MTKNPKPKKRNKKYGLVLMNPTSKKNSESKSKKRDRMRERGWGEEARENLRRWRGEHDKRVVGCGSPGDSGRDLLGFVIASPEFHLPRSTPRVLRNAQNYIAL
ncbi:hypothetical protein B296_00023377 [Ensete ventricosum]|uniref:Uncharacterized protein n=1 Tax=Ensete ventricosum TaxID=4639 RepID=A0A427AWY2_ENSVE|nr:hypothetical protein B296_00023377 [Ensete ventricosum]